MAANMQQMPNGGPYMPQQQNRPGMGQVPASNIHAYIMNLINSQPSTAPGSWQSMVPIAHRIRVIHELSTNSMLASGDANVQHLKVAQDMFEFEQHILRTAPDKSTYDRLIHARMNELLTQRQNQAPRMQESLSMQQQLQQRQKMLMNAQQNPNAAMMRAQMAAGRGMGRGQQPFQHLQNPMQLSQLQQQAPQMGLGFNNGMGPQMNNPQQGFLGPGASQQPFNPMQLTDVDKQMIHRDAHNQYQMLPELQRSQLESQLMRAMTPHALQQAQANGKNLVMEFFQKKISQKLMFNRQQQMQQQRQQQGMPANFQAMPMQPGQQRQTNPMMNNMGQPGAGISFGDALSEQKQGVMAERQGQVVVPANSGPGSNGAPQAQAVNMQHPNMLALGAGQPRPPQMTGFDMQQLQRQAQIQQQQQQQQQQHQQQQKARQQAAANLHGQPGGLGGPIPGSQPPSMNTLNAPGPPPGAMGQISGPQGNPGFGPGPDPRFNQPGQSNTSMMWQQMLARANPEARARMLSLPPEQLQSMYHKFTQEQGAQNGANFPNNPHQAGFQNQQAGANVPLEMRAMMLRQQQAQERQRQITALRNSPQAMQAMDNMDFPRPQIQAMLPLLPDGLTKWGQLKNWLSQATEVPDELKNRLYNGQVQHFLQSRMSRGPVPNPQQPGSARPPPTQQDLDQIPVTSADIQRARTTYQRFRDVPEPQLRRLLQQMKWQSSGTRPQPGQGAPQPMPTLALQPGGTLHTPQGLPQGQSVPVSAPAPESEAIVRAAAQPNKPHRPPQQPKSVSQHPPTATPNKKRPNQDDLDTSSQAPTVGSRPDSQAGQSRTDVNPTEAQLASMTSEQRQKWEQTQLNRLFTRLNAEEKQNFDALVPQVVTFANEEVRKRYMDHLMKCATGMNQLTRLLLAWYTKNGDQGKLRAFFRMRMRVMNQFQDGQKMQVLKDQFTLPFQELQNSLQFLQAVFTEIKSTTDAQAAQQSGQPASNQAQAPLSQSIEGNSAKQPQNGIQSHSKLPQRPSSKDVQPPAAPTSTQAPFHFGASPPDGKPLYAAATPQMGELYLPRKKMRTGMQTSSPAGGSQTASPQTKALSPDLRKQQEPKPAPQKPTFPCTVPNCEMGGAVFSSDALRKKHVDEFHMQPFQDPEQFLQQAITEVFDHVNQLKANTGGAGTQNSKPDDKTGVASRVADMNAPGPDAQSAVPENPNLANGTIDPQSLFSSAFVFDPIAGGVISNTSLYRSVTPNEDTPESSKDSGASEPSSDIPEASSLDIDIDLWTPELACYEGMYISSPGNGDNAQGDDERYYAAGLIEHIVANRAYEIPQSIDMSLYSMDC